MELPRNAKRHQNEHGAEELVNEGVFVQRHLQARHVRVHLDHVL